MSLGPLTTTFAPPADCVASSALYWVNTASTFYWLHGRPLQTSCFPDNYSPYQNQYYSPGICPVGYTRACESRSASETRATCCPQGNYVCASTSTSYSYPWGPTLGCMSVYRVDTETSFTTIDGTPTGGETAGTPMSIYAPGTIMAYGIVIRNSQAATATATTTQTSGSASDTLQTASSALASETASSSIGAAAAGETQASSSDSGGGLSTGAAAGIGIATAVGIMAIGGVALWMFWTRRRKRKQQQQQQEAEAEEQQHARAATGMSSSPEGWSATTWSTTPATALTYPHQQPAIQVNWQPTELADERGPREMSAEGRLLPVEKDGRGLYWR
ncbi:hypothetical protein Hte_003714 [Hypoxylon texense]